MYWTGLDRVEDCAAQDRPSGMFPTPKVANYEGNWELVNGEIWSFCSVEAMLFRILFLVGSVQMADEFYVASLRGCEQVICCRASPD